ncbi:MAG: T9SS type A sorting domain-containing protein [Flavobacteriaceae bacterium]|nr:T9SS type A sorting domain-containing protein [Flavobacteriaceae bacterium]
MRTLVFLVIGFTTICNLQAQHINCPGLYLDAVEIDCPAGPSLIISVNYPLQTEFDLKLIRTSTGEIVEEFTVTDPEGTNNSLFVHNFGVLETGNWTVTLNSYEYYWGGELICEVTKQVDLMPCGTLSVKDTALEEIAHYPNPVKNNMTLKFSSGSSYKEYNLSLFTIEGKIVLNYKATPIEGHIKISNLSHLIKGMYILKIEDSSNKNHKNFKIIKK